jgi:hypothetical protein
MAPDLGEEECLPGVAERRTVSGPGNLQKTIVLLEAEPAAVLIRALVRTLCMPGHSGGNAVGAGFRLLDDPLHPAGLGAGRFDDAGFASEPVVLADGCSIVGTLGFEGRMRRSSFRDPPSSAITTLVVSEGEETVPNDGLWVDGLRVHPLENEVWILEIDGFVLEGGQWAGRFGRNLVPVRPAELARRCAGAMKGSRLCSNDTQTPPLLFDGLA